jgi:HSP20 family protein
MALTLWKDKSPTHLLEDLKGHLDKWFGEYFSKNKEAVAQGESIFSETGSLMRFPVVDIQEQKDKYIVNAEIPGMKKDEIEVEYRDGYLTILGEKKFEHEEKKKDFHRIERSYGSFHRTFEIPEEINEEEVKGEYKNGVLSITLPMKNPEKRRVKKIEIE